jgi:phosphatidylserine/phosphatidylglycerophosphate/cardiolipin synthase-like enzyme
MTTALIALSSFAAAPYASSPFGSILNEISANKTSKSKKYQNNRILILDEGDKALLARIHLIRNASKSIDIQTFIWTNDECGRLMMYELVQAAGRGVKVRIIADQFVSNKDPKIMAFLVTVSPNIEVKHYRPVADYINPDKVHVMLKTVFRFKKLNQRMHNKIMVFDNSIAITGGRNIENSYYNFSTHMNFRDRDALVIGPVVADMTKSFESFWKYKYSVPSSNLIDVQNVIKNDQIPQIKTRKDYLIGDMFKKTEAQAADSEEVKSILTDKITPADKVTFLSDVPGKNRSGRLRGEGRITRIIAKTVSGTENELIIQSPYFILSKKAVKLFKKLSKKSPAVDIIVSSNSFGSTDNIAAYSANYRLRSTTIEKLGMMVYEFKPHPAELLQIFPQYPKMLKKAKAQKDKTEENKLPFLCIHAKSFVCDSRIAYIGSYNLDPRSENLNTEVGLLIEDRTIARELKNKILQDCKPDNSWVIAKVEMPLHLDKVNMLLQGISGLTPIDVWPIRNTSSFELIPGKTAVRPNHPDFYKNYRNAGCFPGAESSLSKKEITTRIYKAIGGLATPIL